MSGIKKLAGQTLWYGAPRIVARFLNFAISLLGFQLFDPNGSYAFTQVYAVIPFFNILFTYGLETSFFRFAQTEDKQKLYNTLNISVLVSTIVFTCLLLYFQAPLGSFLELEDHPEFITWMIGILFFDTLYTLPLSKLRLEEKPKKYAFINVVSIVLNVILILFFYYVARPAREKDPASFLGSLFNPSVGIGYFILSNLIASAVTLLLLLREFATFRFRFDTKLWSRVMEYSYPLIIVGLGGMINEMLSRVIYRKVLDLDAAREEFELGVFGANYKLAMLITIFIQVFRLAAEPFFFNHSKHENARFIYARVMKFFVITCCFMFLFVSLFLEFWVKLIASRYPAYAEGIHIVPVLTMGNVFLGVYYNLSIWYKLTNRNLNGAYLTIAGAAITIALNILLIPAFHYTGAAWATLFCYGFMMVASYLQGQKYYPIPYARKKLIAYISLCTLLYLVHHLITSLTKNTGDLHLYIYYGLSISCCILFLLLVINVERKELEKIDFLKKWVYR